MNDEEREAMWQMLLRGDIEPISFGYNERHRRGKINIFRKARTWLKTLLNRF